MFTYKEFLLFVLLCLILILGLFIFINCSRQLCLLKKMNNMLDGKINSSTLNIIPNDIESNINSIENI